MSESKSEISIEALRLGDRREFARLVDAYSGPLYRLALKMLGNPPDAEDALQNTFLKAFQHMDEFEGRSSLSTWLYRIASNEALMLLRKRRPETTFTDVTPEDEDDQNYDPVQFTDWCCLPEEELLTDRSTRSPGSRRPASSGNPADRFRPARYRRPVHPGDQPGARFERDSRQDPPAACPLTLAGRIEQLLW